MKMCKVCITWPEHFMLLAYIYRYWIVASIAVAVILPMWLYHVDRDNGLKTRILELEAQVTACNDVRDLALSIEQTPSGSRTDAGRTLARR